MGKESSNESGMCLINTVVVGDLTCVHDYSRTSLPITYRLSIIPSLYHPTPYQTHLEKVKCLIQATNG